MADPELDDPLQLLPQLAPRLGLEVERVDVLVLLARVLRVLDGPVGAMLEPLRVRLRPGVIGRALERDVQGDLDAELVARGGDEMFEVLDRPELRMHGRVAALTRSDRPRAAGVALPRRRHVVLPLAVRVPD